MGRKEQKRRARKNARARTHCVEYVEEWLDRSLRNNEQTAAVLPSSVSKIREPLLDGRQKILDIAEESDAYPKSCLTENADRDVSDQADGRNRSTEVITKSDFLPTATKTKNLGFQVELHCHSTSSDGTLPPEKLVARAASKQVKILALTDHDTFAGVPAAMRAAKPHKICIIPGVEVSCFWEHPNSQGSTWHSIHVLGYFQPASLRHGSAAAAFAAALEREGEEHQRIPATVCMDAPATSSSRNYSSSGCMAPYNPSSISSYCCSSSEGGKTSCCGSTQAAGEEARAEEARRGEGHGEEDQGEEGRGEEATREEERKEEGWWEEGWRRLVSALQRIREGRSRRAAGMVERLRRMGVDVSMEDVLRESGPNTAPGRPHIANALLRKGLVTTFQEAFDRYLGDKRGVVGRGSELPACEAISLIRRAGGFAAHPWTIDAAVLRNVLEAAHRDGFLDGLEVYQDGGIKEEYGVLADEFQLLKLGGSDFHGKHSSNEVDLGGSMPSPVVLKDFLTALEEGSKTHP